MTVQEILPIFGLVAVIAGAAGAWAGVKYQAKQAKESGDANSKSINQMAVDMAVLRTEVRHLTEGLQEANKAVTSLAQSLANIQLQLMDRDAR